MAELVAAVAIVAATTAAVEFAGLAPVKPPRLIAPAQMPVVAEGCRTGQARTVAVLLLAAAAGFDSEAAAVLLAAASAGSQRPAVVVAAFAANTRQPAASIGGRLRPRDLHLWD